MLIFLLTFAHCPHVCVLAIFSTGMCQTSPPLCSQSERSAGWRIRPVLLCSKRIGPPSRTLSGGFCANRNQALLALIFIISERFQQPWLMRNQASAVQYSSAGLGSVVWKGYSCAWTVLNFFWFLLFPLHCRIIATCGELLRQCGAYEQQLSNK